MKPQILGRSNRSRIKVHFEHLSSNYVLGWVCSAVTIGTLESVSLVEASKQIKNGRILAPRSDVSEGEDSLCVGFAFVLNNFVLKPSKNYTVEFRCGNDVMTVELPSLRESLALQGAIVHVESMSPNAVTGWMGFIEPSLHGQDFYIKTQMGKSLLHFGEARPDVCQRTGVPLALGWNWFGVADEDFTILDDKGELVTSIGGTQPSQTQPVTLGSRSGSGASTGWTLNDLTSLPSPLDVLGQFRFDSNLEFLKVRNPAFRTPVGTISRITGDLLVIRESDLKNGKSGQDAWSIIKRDAPVPSNLRISTELLRPSVTIRGTDELSYELNGVQVEFLKDQKVDLPLNDVDYADFLVRFVLKARRIIGGINLLLKSQIDFLNATYDARDQSKVPISNYVAARFRLLDSWRTVYSLDDNLGRAAILANLWIDELFNGFSTYLISEEIRHFLGLGSSEGGFISKIVFLSSRLDLGVRGDQAVSEFEQLLQDGYLEWLAGCSPDHPLLTNGWRRDSVRSDQVHASSHGKASATSDICVVGTVGHRSGVGRNADNTVAALTSLGLQCSTVSLPVTSPLFYREVQHCNIPDNSISIVHLQPDYFSQFCQFLPNLGRTQKIIPFFAWETQRVPLHLADTFSFANEIWVPSDFVAEAMRRSTEVPVRVVPHAILGGPVNSLVTRSQVGLRDSAFVIFFSFDVHSTLYRKNPSGILNVFEALQDHGEDVQLLLKIRNFGTLMTKASEGDFESSELLKQLRRMHDVVLITGEMAEMEARSLYLIADAYLSLHRSEGFGYTLAEAMYAGLPTIGTGFSGNLQFMSSENSWLVPFRLTEVDIDRYPYCVYGDEWAEPSEEKALEMVLEIISDSNSAGMRARRGQSDIGNWFSLEQMANVMSDYLLSSKW